MENFKSSVDLCKSVDLALVYALRYDDDTGQLVWKNRYEYTWVDVYHNKHRAGFPLTNTCTHGYKRMSLSWRGKVYQLKSHRVIWFLVYGYWPSVVDHINGDKSDNLLSNLRECSYQENNWNRVSQKTSKTGVKGVDLYHGKFRARGYKGGKRYNLGVYDKLQDAKEAYEKFSKPFQGEFFRE